MLIICIDTITVAISFEFQYSKEGKRFPINAQNLGNIQTHWVQRPFRCSGDYRIRPYRVMYGHLHYQVSFSRYIYVFSQEVECRIVFKG